jgi:hypothetical protein
MPKVNKKNGPDRGFLPVRASEFNYNCLNIKAEFIAGG